MPYDRYYDSHQIIVGLDPEIIAASDKKLRLAADGGVEIYVSPTGDIIIDSTDFSVTSGGNLTIAGDLTVGGAISGSIGGSDISGDITVDNIDASGNIDVDGNISADQYNYNSSIEFVRYVDMGGFLATFNLDIGGPDFLTNVLATSYNGAGPPERLNTPTLLIGSTDPDDWGFYLDLTPHIPNGATLGDIQLNGEAALAWAPSQTGPYEFECKIQRSPQIGTSGWSDVETVNSFGFNGTGLIRAGVTFSNINVTFDTKEIGGYMYRAKFTKVESGENIVIGIYSIELTFRADSIDQALSKDQ